MAIIHFHKYQGLGNDFVLFEGEALRVFDPLSSNLIRWICDRRFGIGGDGVLLAAPPEGQGAVKMIYYNSDGSPSETCFNGLRCIALHAVRSGMVRRNQEFIIESPTGDVGAIVDSKTDSASIELSGPTFDPDRVPVRSEAPVIDRELNIAGISLVGTALSLGNPHFVVWKEQGDLDMLNRDVRLIGASVEKAEIFPHATNFELAIQRGPTEALMAVWERGVGPTLACGSGATATVCAGVKAGRLPPGRPVTVHMAGGDLEIETAADLQRVKVTGGAEFVFSGDFEPPMMLRI